MAASAKQRCPSRLPEAAEYIDTPQGLERLCHRLKRCSFIALDTEFVREKTYFPRLCLIQVATQSVLALIDPLALTDLSPLIAVMDKTSVTKVFHAGRQDLEIFYELTGRLPQPLFDTQLAATLLGHGDQIGYAALVEARCGVVLEKAHTRTDWTARPLSPGQLAYAADDVRYLVPLYQHLRRQLEQDGRLAWLATDLAALGNPETYAADPQQAWTRVRGSQGVSGKALERLRQLAAWREQKARLEDRPRRWVINDEALVDLARLAPVELASLAQLRGMDATTAHRYGPALLEVIHTRQGEATPPSSGKPREALSGEQEALVDYLLAVVRLQALTQRVTLASLASRRDLEAVVLGERDLPLLRGWRRALAGEQVLAVLEGRARLAVVAGQLVIVNS